MFDSVYVYVDPKEPTFRITAVDCQIITADMLQNTRREIENRVKTISTVCRIDLICTEDF